VWIGEWGMSGCGISDFGFLNGEWGADPRIVLTGRDY
jgi:hypothetical protein